MKAPPWWASAIVGIGIIIVIVVVTTSSSAKPPLPHYGWYTDAKGHLTTDLIVDEMQYLRLVDQSAGDSPGTLAAPFTSRVLTPWIASHLPFSAVTSLRVVNVVSLAVGTIALALLTMDLTRSRRATLVAVLVWSASFPTARYLSGAFVDASAVGLVPVVLLLLHRRLLVPAAGVFAAAIWMKETTLSILPMIIAFEWLQPNRSTRRRVVTSAGWIALAVVAYRTAGVLSGDHLIVFASWVPRSLSVVKRMLLFNFLSLNRIASFVLTVLPAAVGTWAWIRHRRDRATRVAHDGTPTPPDHDATALADHDAVPLVIGCLSTTIVALYTMPTAVFGGRTAWMALIPGAVLIAGWVADSSWSTIRTDLRSGLRVAVVAGLALGLAVVVFSSMATKVVATRPDVLDERYLPRLTGVPTEPEDLFMERVSGHGTGTVDLPDDESVLIEFESTEPIVLSSGGEPLVGSGRTLHGVVMSDSDGRDDLRVETEGDWEVIVRPVSSAMFWESISQIEGTGPDVIVFPGGFPSAFSLHWDSDDPHDRIELVGGCRLGTCGSLAHDSVVPAGTEALVIDASGDWSMTPDAYDGEEPEPILDGTVIATE